MLLIIPRKFQDRMGDFIKASAWYVDDYKIGGRTPELFLDYWEDLLHAERIAEKIRKNLEVFGLKIKRIKVVKG